MIACCLIGAFLWSSLKARELATKHAKNACKSHNLQFLDYTVAVDQLKPARDPAGSVCMRRRYAFEYTSSAREGEGTTVRTFRDRGTVTMLGFRLVEVNLPFVRDDEGTRIYFQ